MDISSELEAMNAELAELRIGVSGWSYDTWRGRFYPEDLPQRRLLEYVSREVNSVEINGSFYSLQRPATYRSWYEQVPDDFVFAVKGSRFITHMKKLKDVETPLANFFASGVLRLGEKLGPFLWQFQDTFRYRPDRFRRFLELLPGTTGEAASLARRHAPEIVDESWCTAEHDGTIRHAFEMRHPSYFTPEFIGLLREFGGALVVSDSPNTWPCAEEVTSDFVYVRLHGGEELYTSNYTGDQLDWWADRIRAWRSGGEPTDARRLTNEPPPEALTRDVYVYFDNDARGHAPFNAVELADRMRTTGADQDDG